MPQSIESHRRAVLVTGASSGIGKACVLHLSGAGFEVFAGVRRAEDADRAVAEGHGRVTPLLLDVTDEGGVRSARDAVRRSLVDRGLWGLVNNAGVAVGGPLEFVTRDELRYQLEVNTVATVALAQAFLPLLRRTRGRIVNVGSVSGRVSAPFLGPYAASKFALRALGDALRLELRPWGVHVALVEPGPVRTPIWSKSLEGSERTENRAPDMLLDVYGPVLARLRRRLEETGGRGMPASAVAAAVAHALTSDRPRAHYRIGRSAWAQVWLSSLLPTRLRDRAIARSIGLG